MKNMKNENLIQLKIEWQSIDEKYKHVRMYRDERFFAFEHTPSIAENVWRSTNAGFINITDLVNGDISKLVWESFAAEREYPEAIWFKKSTPIIYYTKKMQDNNVSVLDMLYINNIGNKCRLVGISPSSEGEIFFGRELNENNGMIIKTNLRDECKPIDNRTEKEKLIDDVTDFLMEIDDDSIFLNRDQALDIAADLFESSKFTIIKKGE